MLEKGYSDEYESPSHRADTRTAPGSITSDESGCCIGISNGINPTLLRIQENHEDQNFGEESFLYAHTYTYTDMGTKTISISDDAYERLSRLKGGTGMSFSEVILKFTPPRKKLSEILKELGPNQDLADSIEKASREMRKARM